MEGKNSLLKPPFESTVIKKALRFTSPAAIAYRESLLRPQGGQDEMKSYLELDLNPVRLDRVYCHLHYAGAPRFARPLHRQKLIGREIAITEDISEHLVWHQSKTAKLFIKPLRSYLFSEEIWRINLCSDVGLHQSACGFVLSYVWLVSWESDFQIAQELKLVPKDLSWEDWTDFVHSFTSIVNTKSLHQVARRYQYGELRLSRLNRIYRYTPTAFSLRNLFRGFTASSSWYQDVFRSNFGWLFAVFAIFTVLLSGLQVALMTDQLSHNSTFHAASYGFAVFSLVALAGSLATIFGFWVVLLIYVYLAAKLYHHRVQSARRLAVTQTTV
ncbi:hypothetical protein GQ44DRAFT_712301 [Phaeosphaeriaceae sp. PMI808]|nr:hypothetical protein GQ44DRAFT_712301 [Phaeosphaeriaceae sp. PMI808]